MYDREIKQLTLGKARTRSALPSLKRCFDRRSNIVNPAQKEAQTFGHSNIFATLSGTNSQLYLLNIAGVRAINIWIFLQTCKEV